jgi:hypothetical protein
MNGKELYVYVCFNNRALLLYKQTHCRPDLVEASEPATERWPSSEAADLAERLPGPGRPREEEAPEDECLRRAETVKFPFPLGECDPESWMAAKNTYIT